MRKSILFSGVAAAPLLLSAPMIGHMSAYANTLTGLIPDLYAALDVVSRELVGFIPAASRNSTAERAAVGENVTYPIAPDQTGFDVTPAMVIPEPSDNVIGNGQVTITKSRGVAFGITGEEQRGLNNGAGYLTVQAGLIAQALRTLTNEVETDVAVAAAAGASRAWGTAGTTPFATGIGETAQLKKVLDDNGAPLTGRALIIDTTAGANMRSVPNLTRVNEAGTQMTLRQGMLLDVNGFAIAETAKAVNFVKGTNAGATTNAAGYAVGATVITLAAAGTGTIKAGDAITFAGDVNKYIVAVGNASVAAAGTITLAKPGLRVAIPAAATAITTGASYTANVGFSADALQLVTRLPALPTEGDARIDGMTITDPRSGLTLEVAIYAGYRKIRYELALSWGVKAVKSNHIAILLG